MKKKLGVVGLLLCLLAGGVMIARAASGTPEVDRANANMGFQGPLKAVSCTGEDGVTYLTYHGAWTGSVSQVLPDPTDYSLSGNARVTGIAWTISTATLRGTLTGTFLLTNAAGAVTFKGPLILVTQGRPAVGAAVPARGWINALSTGPDEGATPPAADDSLIANVEFALTTTNAIGQFGDAPGSLGVPDFSVVTNVAPRALDGVC